MLYSVLIYGVEGVFDRLPEDEQEAILDKHRAVQEALAARGVLGPVAKLMDTASAVSVRDQGASVLVTDGPFAETKEQLLGIYMMECQTIEEAIEAVKELPLGIAAYEIRPVAWANLTVGEGPQTGNTDDPDAVTTHV